MATFEELMALLQQMNANRPKREFNEIKKLDKLLTDANIPHEFEEDEILGGGQLVYYGPKGKPTPEPGTYMGAGIGAVCSAIENGGSYGNEEDLIEISGLLTDEEYEENSVKGYLTADDVFKRIKAHWESTKS